MEAVKEKNMLAKENNKRQKLNTNAQKLDLPRLGLGTYQIVSKDIILSAFQIGYRHLDLASCYGNLNAVKEALIEVFKPKVFGGLGIDRSSVFITMKVFEITSEIYIPDLLKRVGVQYFDLLLYHIPNHIFQTQSKMEASWQTILAEQRKQNVVHIGVSNCYKQHLNRLLKYCNDNHLAFPYANEILINPYVMPVETIEFCKYWNIKLIAYCPLGFAYSETLLGDEKVKLIAYELDCKPSQVVLSWLIKQGFFVIPKSSNEDHLKSNFNLQETDIHFNTNRYFTKRYDEMMHSLKMESMTFFMIECSLDAFNQELSWDNGEMLPFILIDKKAKAK
jgi:diketogulonate reductase-like aldo/keto reductase